MTAFNDLPAVKQHDEIRKAFRNGKRTVEIAGMQFDLKLIRRKNVVHTIGSSYPNLKAKPTTTIRQTEEWIEARRSDGKLVPLFITERVAGKNSAVRLK